MRGSVLTASPVPLNWARFSSEIFPPREVKEAAAPETPLDLFEAAHVGDQRPQLFLGALERRMLRGETLAASELSTGRGEIPS